MQSFVDIPKDHDFSLYNIPFGVFYTNNNKSNARCGTILGETVIDLCALYELGYFSKFPEMDKNFFRENSLNSFMSLGNQVCYRIRRHLQDLFSVTNHEIKTEHRAKILIPKKETKNLMPIKVADYVDFYSNEQHATNVGKMFRDEKNPLLPNWKHIPIGYHGRSSSLVVSGTPIKRPMGQIRPNDNEPPFFAPSRQMDFELEMAFITNKNTEIGHTFSPDEAENYIFGVCLFNDWSSRDIQKWEYVPLGPFLGKSFASSLSPWIVTLDALREFSLNAEPKDSVELDYLKCTKKGLFDIELKVFLQSQKMQEPFQISSTNYKYMYWNMFQQLAHMSSNGSPINVGDVYGSGTISGPTEKTYGSMLELAWKGTNPITLPDGTTRKFLEDGDNVIFHGFAEKNGIRVGFGDLNGTLYT